MRGYPKHINTKEDIENLMNDHPEFNEQLKKDMDEILNEPNKIKQATSPIDPNDTKKGYNTEEIDNPHPKWKRMGFKNKNEVQTLRNLI